MGKLVLFCLLKKMAVVVIDTWLLLEWMAYARGEKGSRDRKKS